MENIGILTGGDSAEYNISILSAKTVLSNLSDQYKGYIVHLKKNIFTVTIKTNSIAVDTKDFSFTYKRKKIKIRKVFMALHGPPAENGVIQRYFDKLNIKYTSCNANVSRLTFHKYNCNNKLKNLGFKCAKSHLHTYNKKVSAKDIIKKIKLPCFVKPNGSGSSYGISKVNKESELEGAIKNSLLYDKEVVIEEAIIGMEVSCGVFFNGTTSIALPITEIETKNEFFDYSAKYNGESNEITPARISEEMTRNIQNTSINIYNQMNLRGICRIDFIINNNAIYVIEINTIPGLSKESIIPKQIKSARMRLSEIFTLCLIYTDN